ncbi:STAS domain-containing protein [Actinoplanes italicus]|uniref:Anti-sigma factor antagonist n=1 Tax=Actinoplanes italicus TaxID=113567 RepID=A0A2T0JX85_9ACTN|nr:STAS domain-containing protein [Actinoplanes italicus]PRX12620.1 anti-anti-sigma factor [Actinoplanes italicus]
MSDFETHTRRNADTLVVVLAGECDLRSRDEMTAALLDAVGSSARVAVDLAGVRFLDSSGLHALVTAHHAALERSGILYVVNATGTVETVLQITGILELLQQPAPAEDTAETGRADQRG